MLVFLLLFGLELEDSLIPTFWPLPYRGSSNTSDSSDSGNDIENGRQKKNR